MMNAKRFALCLLAVLATAAAAPDRKPPQPRPVTAPKGREAGPRAVGLHVVPHPGQPVHATNNPPHQVQIRNQKTAKDENHAVIVEHRPAHVIDRDPRLRIVHRGYHPTHDWGHFHVARGGWWRFWGVSTWEAVGTVTCEAANEVTGELYPVSQDRDASGWDDDTVNVILDQALDDCMAEAGSAPCAPATPACTFQSF